MELFDIVVSELCVSNCTEPAGEFVGISIPSMNVQLLKIAQIVGLSSVSNI